MSGWWFLVIYLAGLPVMFKATGYWMWRTLDNIGSMSWGGMEWFLLLLFTFLWPMTWVCLLVVVIIDKASERELKAAGRLVRWTAPKKVRNRLDTDDHT